jgi:hypothetical protein
MLLAKALASGKSDILVLFATEMGATERMAQAAAALGAQIQARFDDVGYFRARAPVARFDELRRLPGVLIARINAGALSYDAEIDHVSYAEPRKTWADSVRADSVKKDSLAKDSARTAALPLPPEAARQAESPYVAANNARSYDLRRIDPRFDGRGVTIAILEGGILDLLNPVLQKATALDGHDIPKIRGVITSRSYDPDLVLTSTLLGDTGPYGSGLADPDKERVRDVRMVPAGADTVMADTTVYRLGHRGSLAFGFYNKGKIKYGVLWDVANRRAWVDTDGDHDFTNEKALADINDSFDVGILKPLDSTAKEPKHSTPFAVHFDSVPGRIRIYEGAAGHQTMVAGVAAGRDILGVATSSAPGAQIMIVDAGVTLHEYIESWIRAARDPRVDLVTSSQIGETFPADGESFLALILDRVYEVYGKPLFASAHNAGPMLTTTSEPSTSRRLMSIGGYVAAATYKAHYGWDMPAQDYLISYSSRGPALNGGAKPDVVAPVLSISGRPCSADKPEHTVMYRFPTCYGLGGGTSSASPHATSAAAALLSAARQSNLPADAQHITWALRTGARFLPYYPAHEQGNGLIDVVRSYELLKLGVDVPDIEARGPVNIRLARFLREPGMGDGLYERDGWTAGDARTRTITLTRRNGPATPVTYGLRWRANDGTFSTTLTTVTLPLNTPVSVPVRVAPQSLGVHSAHLLIVDRADDVPVRAVLATVMAAARPTAANHYTVTQRSTKEWPHAHHFFVDVPAGTAALELTLAVNRGHVHTDFSDGTAGYYIMGRGFALPYRYSQTRTKWIDATNSAVEIIADPEPGTMEVISQQMDNPQFGGDSAAYHVPSEVELTVTARRVSAKLASAASATGGGATAATFEFTNAAALLHSARVLAEPGIRRSIRGAVTPANGPTSFLINVDSGTTSLRVEVVPETKGAETTLFLYDCADKRCAMWDAAMRQERKNALVVANPRPGPWKAVIDVPKGDRAAFAYTEIMTHPKYGRVSNEAAPAAHDVGSSWKAPVLFGAGEAPPLGYELVGVADVTDPAMEAREVKTPLGTVKPWIPSYRPVRLGGAVVPLARGHAVVLQAGSAKR